MSDEGWPASDEWVWDFDAEIDVMEDEFRMNDVELVGRLALSTLRRTWKVLHAVLTVTKRHVPKWLAGVLTVCLFIPGPLDEFLVLIVIGVMVKFKPVMRRELLAGIRSAWTLDIERAN